MSLGKVAAADRDAAAARIRATADLADACTGADLVVEAVPEKIELKRELFAAVDRAAPDTALLATNTSSLSVAEIAGAVADPSRMIGMHFFNPVHLMKLLEIVRHGASDPSAIDTAVALGERWARPRSWSTTAPASPRAASAWCSASRPSAWSRRASPRPPTSTPR